MPPLDGAGLRKTYRRAWRKDTGIARGFGCHAGAVAEGEQHHRQGYSGAVVARQDEQWAGGLDPGYAAGRRGGDDGCDARAGLEQSSHTDCPTASAGAETEERVGGTAVWT